MGTEHLIEYNAALLSNQTIDLLQKCSIPMVCGSIGLRFHFSFSKSY